MRQRRNRSSSSAASRRGGNHTHAVPPLQPVAAEGTGPNGHASPPRASNSSSPRTSSSPGPRPPSSSDGGDSFLRRRGDSVSSFTRATDAPAGSAVDALNNSGGGSPGRGGTSAAAAAAHSAAEGGGARLSRWRDWWVRSLLGWVMILGVIAYVGLLKQAGIVLLVFVFQTLIYRELVKIALVDSKERDMPGFSWFYMYWFGVCAYFMYTKTLQVHLVAALAGTSPSRISTAASPIVDRDDPSFLSDTAAGRYPDGLGFTHGGDGALLHHSHGAWAAASVGGFGSLAGTVATLGLRLLSLLVTHYVPVAFALYTAGFVAFVFSLQRRRNFRYQFAQFAYCHIALAVVVVQSTFLVANCFQGLLWFFLPVGIVVTNDTFAYIFGFFFGRTPLIRLSPKKTWEGFAGGAAATFVFAFVFTGLMQSTSIRGMKYLMLCPVESGLGLSVNECDTNTVAHGVYAVHSLSSYLAGLPLLGGEGGKPALLLARALPAALESLPVSRMQLHSLVLAAFASVVAPFGGFFASGFKRAFKIKDFSHAIPGHGGFTDRMDCQIIMGAISYVYAHYLLHMGLGFHGGKNDVSAMFTRIVAAAAPEDLVRLYDMLGCFIDRMGYVVDNGGGGGAAAAAASLAAEAAGDAAATTTAAAALSGATATCSTAAATVMAKGSAAAAAAKLLAKNAVAACEAVVQAAAPRA